MNTRAAGTPLGACTGAKDALPTHGRARSRDGARIQLGRGMATSAQQFCDTIAAAFSEGRTEGLSAHYLYPLTIYTPSGVRIEMTPDQTAKAVFARRAAALQAGMKSVRARVNRVEESERGRIIIHLSWDFLDAVGRPFARNVMRYFGRRTEEGALCIEMIEFSEMAFSGVMGIAQAPRTRN